jgi:hypothetical protein
VLLEESKALLQCGELLEEFFLGELALRAMVFAFLSSVDCFFHDVLLVAEKAQRNPPSR